MKTERFDLPNTLTIQTEDGRTRITSQFFATLTRDDCHGSRTLLRAWEKKVKEHEMETQPKLL